MFKHLDSSLVLTHALNGDFLPRRSQQLVKMGMLIAEEVNVALSSLHILYKDLRHVLKSLRDTTLQLLVNCSH